MKPSAIILDTITVPGISTAQFIRLAAANGYDGVSLWIHAPVETLQIQVLRAGTSALRETRKALDDAGLVARGGGAFDVAGDLPRDTVLSALDAIAELGGDTAPAVCMSALETRDLADRVAAMAEDAAERGIWISLEFMAPAIGGDLNSIARAMQIVEQSGADNVGLIVDMLHLTRTGATIDEIRSIPPERVRYIQLCDGPATMPEQDQLAEATVSRLYPGDGAFALREMLAALPDGKPVGIETPRRGLAPADVARDAMAASRKFLEKEGADV